MWMKAGSQSRIPDVDPDCSVRATRGGEAAHTGPHGLGQKSSDLSAIPLCARHHRTGPDSYHKLGPRKFAEAHRLNVSAIVARLRAKPLDPGGSGQVRGPVGRSGVPAGNHGAGLARAIRRMGVLRREILAEVA